MKKKIKGKSTIATRVAEVKNSRSESNSLTTLATAPEFWFPASRRSVRILSKTMRDIRESARLLARSIKLARNDLVIKSKPSAIITPIDSAIRDSIASLGTTRS